MKMADILRDLANKLDSIEQGTDAPKQTGLSPVGEIPSGDTDTNKMVPPLQAKLEILKKSEGLPNVYDEQGQSQEDEITLMKKRAGLTAVQHEASEDNDVLG
jgi:hypothetical protein